jgi:hypothetical protein
MGKVIAGHKVELGQYGEASVELTSKAEVVVKVEAKVDLLAELEKLAAQTGTKVDDTVVKYIKGLVEAANAVAG